MEWSSKKEEMVLSNFRLKAADKNSLTIKGEFVFGSATFSVREGLRSRRLVDSEYKNWTAMKVTKTSKNGIATKFTPTTVFSFNISSSDEGEFVCDGMENVTKKPKLSNDQPSGELTLHFSSVKDDGVEYTLSFDYSYLPGNEWFTDIHFGDRCNITLE